jgi:hypothetical protein
MIRWPPSGSLRAVLVLSLSTYATHTATTLSCDTPAKEDPMRDVHPLAHHDAPEATEPTLAAVASAYARRMMPSRAWLAMQLALPWAVDFAMRGWWRAGGACVAFSLAGAWGLLDQWLWRRDPAGTARRIGRAMRAVTGTLAALIAAALLLDAFLRLLGSSPIS